MKYLVFVDFDGVLASARLQYAQPKDSYEIWSRLDPNVMEFFNKLHNKFDGVSFVWTTTWRNNVEENLMTEHWAYSMWYSSGFRGKFGTPWRVNHLNDQSLFSRRAEEVRQYLEVAQPKDFIVLDDTDYGFNLHLPVKRFVQTSTDDGMLFKHMKQVMSICGTWDEK